MGLAERLAMMMAEEDEDAGQRPLPEALIMSLQEAHGNYAAGNQFMPGQIVTPRRGYDAKGAGEPHIVLETRAPEYDFRADVGSNAYGKRLDIRVAGMCSRGAELSAWWVESWCFEPYVAA